MKASELIEALCKAIREHGDLPVRAYDGQDGSEMQPVALVDYADDCEGASFLRVRTE